MISKEHRALYREAAQRNLRTDGDILIGAEDLLALLDAADALDALAPRAADPKPPLSATTRDVDAIRDALSEARIIRRGQPPNIVRHMVECFEDAKAVRAILAPVPAVSAEAIEQAILREIVCAENEGKRVDELRYIPEAARAVLALWTAEAPAFAGNIDEVDKRKPVPTAPGQVVLRPQRTPVEIGRGVAEDCLGPLKVKVDDTTYQRTASAVSGAVVAVVARERLEISASKGTE